MEWAGSAVAAALHLVGFALLALSQEGQRERIAWAAGRPAPPIGAASARRLRRAAAPCLLAGLAACLAGHGAGFGSLLWVMLLSAAAFALAFTLSWRPALLAPLLDAWR